MKKTTRKKEDLMNYILNNSKKVIEFKEIQKIRNRVNTKIKESINFNLVSILIMNFGTQEEEIFFRDLLKCKAI